MNDKIEVVAANRLKIKTDAKCDLGSSHCYVPPLFDATSVTNAAPTTVPSIRPVREKTNI